MRSYDAVEKEQWGSITILPYLNISSLVNDTSIFHISWISKYRHILLKTEIATIMTFRSETMGLPAKKASKCETLIETSYVIQFSGFDKRVKSSSLNARNAATFQVFSDNSTKNFAGTAKPKR